MSGRWNAGVVPGGRAGWTRLPLLGRRNCPSSPMSSSPSWALGPAVHGWEDQRWILARIRALIAWKFALDYSSAGVWPGVGVRTGARILIEVGDDSTFPTAGHLAAYAGLAPATRSSGSSIRGEQLSRRGNKQLKRAFFLSAFAPGDPASRAYYDKKISQGKHHTQALLCLVRRRADVLFAMLRDGTFYEPQPAAAG